MQRELNSYMSLNSDLKIHKENMELEFSDKLKRNEELLLSNTLQIQEKENQVRKQLCCERKKAQVSISITFLCAAKISDLKAKINELNENLQSRVDAELNHLNLLTPAESRDLDAIREDYEAQLAGYRRDNENLKVFIAPPLATEPSWSNQKTTHFLFSQSNSSTTTPIDSISSRARRTRPHRPSKVARARTTRYPRCPARR